MNNFNKLNRYEAPKPTVSRRKNIGSGKYSRNNGNNGNKMQAKRFLTPGKIVLLTFLSLLLALFLTIDYFVYIYEPSQSSAGGKLDNAEFLRGTDDEGNIIPPLEPLDKSGDCYTFLIAGCDVSGGPTDTMMLAMFNRKEGKLSIMNIPRDTYVKTAKYSGKINSVYSRGGGSTEGMKYLCQMIQYTFGVEIQKYALLNLQCVKGLVDKIGGVDFDVPLRMKYTDKAQGLYIDLQPGFQHLNGDQAEQLIRFRKGGGDGAYDGQYPSYPSADIDRIKTQQKFVGAIMKKMLGKLDISTITGLFDIASDYMVTNMSVTDAGWFALEISKIKLENIRMHSPVGIWFGSPYNRYELYRDETIEMINGYYNPYKTEIPESNFNIINEALPNYTGYKPEINIDGEVISDLAN